MVLKYKINAGDYVQIKTTSIPRCWSSGRIYLKMKKFALIDIGACVHVNKMYPECMAQNRYKKCHLCNNAGFVRRLHKNLRPISCNLFRQIRTYELMNCFDLFPSAPYLVRGMELSYLLDNGDTCLCIKGSPQWYRDMKHKEKQSEANESIEATTNNTNV